MNGRDYELLAMGWDTAVAAMVHEDGTPVEVAANVNPFRVPVADDPGGAGGAGGAVVAPVDTETKRGPENGAERRRA